MEDYCGDIPPEEEYDTRPPEPPHLPTILVISITISVVVLVVGGIIGFLVYQRKCSKRDLVGGDDDERPYLEVDQSESPEVGNQDLEDLEEPLDETTETPVTATTSVAPTTSHLTSFFEP